jgi:hypothetical protein
MKVFYIAGTVAIVMGIRMRRSTHDAAQDNYRHWTHAAFPAALIAFVTHLCGIASPYRHYFFDLMEFLWTFSIYLEAVAVVPQLIVFQKYQDIDLSLRNYIFSLGAYRALYILNWIYRALFEPHYRHHWVVYFCGVMQVALYVDFGFFYVLHKTQPDYQMWTYPFWSRFCHETSEASGQQQSDDDDDDAVAAETYDLLSDEKKEESPSESVTATDGKAEKDTSLDDTGIVVV